MQLRRLKPYSCSPWRRRDGGDQGRPSTEDLQAADRRLASWVCIEARRVSASYLGVHAEVLGIGTEGFFGDRPRPCKPSGASRGDWKRLLRGDDAPMKSVCPVGTGVPDDAAGAGNRIDHHVSPRAEKAPLHHARAHIRFPAHLAFSLVGLSVPGASRQSTALF
jgi:hypothetical protein